MTPPSPALSPRAALRIFYFALLASLGVYLPFFPAWLRAQGFSGLQMSAIIALMPAMAVLAPPCAGFIADLLGLRGSLLRWLSLGAWLSFAVLASHSLSQEPHSFTFVFACIFLYALFRAPMGMMADVIALEEGSNYGRIRLWGSLGFMVIAVIAGLLIRDPGSRVVPFAISALLTLAALSSIILPPKAHLPPGPVREEMKRLIAQPAFRQFLLASFFGHVSHSAYDLCSGLLFEDLGGSSRFVGIAWGVGTAAEILMLAASPSLLSQSPALRLRSMAYAGTALRWLLMATVQSLPVLLALQLLHAITFALMWLSSIALVKEFSTPRTLATAQGLFVAACASGSVAGMLVWGPLYGASGGSWVFVGAAAAAMIALIINATTAPVRSTQ